MAVTTKKVLPAQANMEDWRGYHGDTSDTGTVQAAIAALLANDGGRLEVPQRTYTLADTITIDQSATTGRFTVAPIIEGKGVSSVFSLTGQAKEAIKILGKTASNENHVLLKDFRVTGSNTVGSKGIYVDRAAYFRLEGLTVEAFDYDLDTLHIEQGKIADCNFRWGLHGARIDSDNSVTDPNSLVLVNNAFANNSKYGLYVHRGNAVTMIGGSVQYNGTTSGTAAEYGAKFEDVGSGYGTVLVQGVAFEGNKGAADFISTQAAGKAASLIFIANSFIRNVLADYVTNNVLIEGASTDARYAFLANHFRHFGTYSPDAGRPYINATNASAIISDLGSNYYQSVLEAPLWASMVRFPQMMLTGLPTSASGLPTGALWNSAGTVKIA